jgi:two-component system NtrC family sensor kinase
VSFWQRLTWWLLGAISPVMIGHGAFVYQRERELQIRNVSGELELYAQIVQRAVEEAQRQHGWEDALRLGRSLEPRELSFAADHRFFWMTRPAEGPRLEEAPAEIRRLLREESPGVRRDSPDHRWRVYRLLRGGDGGVLVFEVSHDAGDVEAFIRRTALEEVLTVFFVALAVALAVALVNRLQVRPVLNRLIAQARRIDALAVEERRGRAVDDEIALLDDEMSRMEQRIAEARQALEQETSAKLAMASQLRHADRLATVGRLAAGVAHEFGTPLTVVRGQARLIMDHPEIPDSERQSAQTIVEQVDRMSRIIRQLLDLARRRGLPQGPCDLGQLLARVSRLLEHEAGRSGVRLAVEAPGEAVLACGDLQQLEQVAINLVMNAIQALGPRGGAVALRCGREEAPTRPNEAAGEPGAMVWFEVDDDGPGIPEEILVVVFEPFVTTKEAGQGTGLGLPLSLGIVRDHGGWIEAHSPPGSGARFRVFLRPLDGDEAAP